MPENSNDASGCEDVPRPYWMPADIDFDSLPQQLQAPILAILNPAYQELVLKARPGVEQSTGITIVRFAGRRDQHLSGTRVDRWKDVTVGAVTTAALFVVSKFAIAAFLAKSTLAEAYGAAGTLVLILVWVFVSALIFLLGAEFTQAWTRSRGRHVRTHQ